MNWEKKNQMQFSKITSKWNHKVGIQLIDTELPFKLEFLIQEEISRGIPNGIVPCLVYTNFH